MSNPVFTAGGTETIVRANDDGTLSLPVAPGRGDDGSDLDLVTLREPLAREFAWLLDLADRVDAESLPLDPIDVATATDEDRARWSEQYQARRKQMFSAESPGAKAILEVVAKLNGAELTFDDLHRFAGRPATLNGIIRGFESPLGGQASPSRNGQSREIVPVPLDLDSEPDAPGSPAGTEPADPSTPTPSPT